MELHVCYALFRCRNLKRKPEDGGHESLAQQSVTSAPSLSQSYRSSADLTLAARLADDEEESDSLLLTDKSPVFLFWPHERTRQKTSEDNRPCVRSSRGTSLYLYASERKSLAHSQRVVEKVWDDEDDPCKFRKFTEIQLSSIDLSWFNMINL